MHWAALLISADHSTPAPIDVAGIAMWALQFTPHVATLESAVLLEVEQSLRLFGGQEGMRAAVQAGAAELGVSAWAWAPTSLAALACARAGVQDAFGEPLHKVLDPLPYACIDAVSRHGATLERLGCKTLGDVRKLPRGGLARRFDAQLLLALDQAYGLRPHPWPWVTLAPTFSARLELPGRVDNAMGLLFGARRLLVQMAGWLAARHCGVTAFTLYWDHDAMRGRAVGMGAALTVRTARATQNVEHLYQLLRENLAQVSLQAPAAWLRLSADEVSPATAQNRSLIADARADGECMHLVLERIAARLGKNRVLRPVLTEDTRMEWTSRWQPADARRPGRSARQMPGPQPTWIFRQPIQLAVQGEYPLYQGPLQLLLGPQRVEGGWWHRVVNADGQARHLHVARDYWVARSAYAGVLWIYQQRLSKTGPGSWFLHGIFA